MLCVYLLPSLSAKQLGAASIIGYTLARRSPSLRDGLPGALKQSCNEATSAKPSPVLHQHWLKSLSRLRAWPRFNGCHMQADVRVALCDSASAGLRCGITAGGCTGGRLLS